MADANGDISSGGDIWSEWVLRRRDAGDAAEKRRVWADVVRYRDRVLDGAGLGAGETVLDLGSGDGLMGLGAIARVGRSLRVIFTDVSAPLLAHVRGRLAELGVANACEFVECSAERLAGVESGSVDAVTSRATLAYVGNKGAALMESFRVLRPGGRISLGEPIMKDRAMEVAMTGEALRLDAARARLSAEQLKVMELRHRIDSAQFPGELRLLPTSPMASFSERDLFRMLRVAGFERVHLELHMDVLASPPTPWNTYLHTAPHPRAATPHDVMVGFTEEERRTYEAAVRPLVEEGRTTYTELVAYATGVKPGRGWKC